MQNWFAIETEAEHRRQEWHQAVAADARSALAHAERVKPRWLRLPNLSLPALKLKRLSAPAFGLPTTIASRHNVSCETAPGD